MMNGMKITGTGHFLPEKTLTNKDLEKTMDTTDEWISSRTGMKTRHILEEGKATSYMCTEASKKALAAAKLDPKDIDMIVLGTSTPDKLFPATACMVQRNLGCKEGIPAFDFEIACSSYIYGLIISYQFIQTGFAKNILFVTGDTMSRFLDYNDRGTAILFADGASACVLRATDITQNQFLGFDFGANGYESEDLLHIPFGGSLNPSSCGTEKPIIKMNGSEVYRLAVQTMTSTLIEACKKASIKVEDLNYIIPHQANIRIMKSVAKMLKVKNMDALINTIEHHANTSGSTVGIALDLSIRNNTIKRGDLLGLTAFGAGLSWGSCIIKY